MVRPSQAPSVSSSGGAKSVDPLTDLNQLLSRLHQTVLRADADRERRLVTNEFERNKVNTNIEFARTLLTRLEQDALSVKALVRRQETQADLKRKREVLEELVERMKDLEGMAVEWDDGGDDESSSGDEDLLGELGGVITTPSESMDSGSVSVPFPPPPEGDSEERGYGSLPGPQSLSESQRKPTEPGREEKSANRLSGPAAEGPETITSQALRSRRPQQPPVDDSRTDADADATATARATGSSTMTALFGSQAATNRSLTQTATTEAILGQQRAEQDALSASILKMASSLKESSRQFAGSLEEDKDVLGRAGQGLDRNESGLQAAARRMGALTRMTEGKGWWGRVLLYAWIYGMMVALVLLVFVLPKLRF